MSVTLDCNILLKYPKYLEASQLMWPGKVWTRLNSVGVGVLNILEFILLLAYPKVFRSVSTFIDIVLGKLVFSKAWPASDNLGAQRLPRAPAGSQVANHRFSLLFS